jgi:hypothetical protein
MVHENLGDVVCILYLADLQAGFWVQGQGSATLNPVICQFVPTWPGVGEGRAVQVASPRPGPTVLSGASSVQRLASSVVFDATGRRVTEPRSGVYFVRAEPQAASPNPQAVRKVVVQE